jgi:hypothetical protein
MKRNIKVLPPLKPPRPLPRHPRLKTQINAVRNVTRRTAAIVIEKILLTQIPLWWGTKELKLFTFMTMKKSFINELDIDMSKFRLSLKEHKLNRKYQYRTIENETTTV